jgi:hypothetical protein
MPDQEAWEPQERPHLKWVVGVENNVTIVRKAARCRCKVLQKASALEGCSASDGVGGENNKHKILRFVDQASQYNSCTWPTCRTILFSYMFVPNLYMFRALVLIIRRIVSIQHLVYVTLCRWPSGMQVWVEHTRRSSIEGYIPDVILIQLILLIMSTWVLETCRDLEQTYTKTELFVKLVIYKHKHKMFIFLSETFVSMLDYVNIYSLLVTYRISVLHNTVHKYELYKTWIALRPDSKTVSLQDRKINLHNTSSINTSKRGTNTTSI